MGLLLLTIITGGIFLALKHKKNKRRSRHLARMVASGAIPAATAAAIYQHGHGPCSCGDVKPPSYTQQHQTWCNGTCAGRCNAPVVQYTPVDTPEEQYGDGKDYFGSGQRVNEKSGVVWDEKRSGKF